MSLPAVLAIVDSAGVRVDAKRSDGTYRPIMLQLPADMTTESVADGDLTYVKLAVAFAGPMKMAEYTVATLPTASAHDNHAIIVSDETGGRTIATSDGTNWRRVSDGAIAS